MVINQIDAFPSSTYQFGVIKNNEWLVEMSETCPFLDEEGWWKGKEKSYHKNDISADHFTYLSNGFFLFERYDLTPKKYIVYNVKNGVYFDNLINRDYSDIVKGDEFLGYSWIRRENGGTDIPFQYFNLDTGECHEIIGDFGVSGKLQLPKQIYDISDGLFFASGETHSWSNFQYSRYSGFFDLSGNMILDLSSYSVRDYHDYCFHDGYYTATCANDSNVLFDITFDVNGDVVETKQVSE